MLEPDCEVFFVPPRIDVLRVAHVESVQKQGDGRAIVRFREVDSIDSAEKLIGMHCLVDRESIPDFDDMQDTIAKDALADWTIVDVTTGNKGRVIRSWSASGNLLGEVVLDGEDEDAIHIVPLADDLVIEADSKAKRVTVELPNGIFEL